MAASSRSVTHNKLNISTITVWLAWQGMRAKGLNHCCSELYVARSYYRIFRKFASCLEMRYMIF